MTVAQLFYGLDFGLFIFDLRSVNFGLIFNLIYHQICFVVLIPINLGCHWPIQWALINCSYYIKMLLT